MRISLLLAALACVAVPLASAQQPEFVVLETSAGQIAIELFWDDAPRHAANFADRASEKFYDGTLFHRIIPGFMIQGGDPLTREGESTKDIWGTGGPSNLDQEFNDIQHVRGIVSMARSADPDSAGSQFFIVHADSNFLDGQYTVFGRVVTQQGLDALDRIAALPTDAGDRPVEWQSAVLESARHAEASELRLLELGEPARAGAPPGAEAPEKYSSSELGFSFDPPAGWILQEPTGENAPDVAVLLPGPGLPPSISFTVLPSDGKTLDQIASDRMEELQNAIDAGSLEILSERGATAGGLEASTVSAQSAVMGLDVRFTDTAVISGDRAYYVSFTSTAPDHERLMAAYDGVLASMEFEGAEAGGGCLVATAAYGTELAPAVQKLREARQGLAGTGAGAAFLTAFNAAYYSFSPALADLERQSPVFRQLVGAAAAPMIYTLGVVSYAQTEAQFVALGALALLANAGIYAGAPVAAALLTKSLGRRPLSARRARAA